MKGTEKMAVELQPLTVQLAARFLYAALVNDDVEVEAAVRSQNPVNFGATLKAIYEPTKEGPEDGAATGILFERGGGTGRARS